MSLGTGPPATDTARRQLPRIIWFLWFDGWHQAPELHRRCLESWELMNCGWEVRPIARKDIPALIGDFLPKYEKLRTAMNPLEKYGGFWIPPAAESDLLRLLLLGLYGGVWADSTMICRRPLDEWLPEKVDPSGFFAFSPEDKEERLPVMSSFLAAEPGHKLVTMWLRRTERHWSTPSARRPDIGFFWLHKLFGELVGDPLVASTGGQVDDEARRLWAAVPKVSGEYGAPGPHFWVKYNEKLRPAPSAEHLRIIKEDVETPMWKLTNHEVKLNDVGPESCYWILLEATRSRARELVASRSEEGEAQQVAVLRLLLETGDRFGCH